MPDSSASFSPKLTEDDLHLFNEGRHFKLYEKLGSHPMEVDGTQGVYFALWAPNAKHVHVMGDFNGWSKDQHAMERGGQSGLWGMFIPGVSLGAG
ncbi:MAG: hypothetical protein VW804_08690 [Verrucomicrobiota bacterium]